MRNQTMRPDRSGRDQDNRRSRRHGADDGDGNQDGGGRRRPRHERRHDEEGYGHQGRRHGGRHGSRGGPRDGGRRGRAKRGEARYILLDLLRDGPKHGYELIKTLEERSGGQYVPSPGTVYPTLQYLEDQGLVRAEADAERRVYHLTEAGSTELEAQAALIDEFWAQFTPPPPTASGQPEVRFLEEEVEHLSRIVWSSLRDAIARNDQATIRQVREVVEACQTQVRTVVAAAAANPDSAEENAKQA